MLFAREVIILNITLTRIKELTDESGLTVRELAAAADCSKSAMQRYIAGERDIPTSVINGLANAFNVHPAYLFGWVDDRHYTPETKNKPTTLTDSELTDNKKALMRLVRDCPEEKADRLLQIMQLFLDNKNKDI